MNTLELICVVIAAVSVLIAVFVVFLNRRKTKNTMEKMGCMLDAAIAGSFTENTFDESMLSALETRLRRYLAECTVTSKNLLAEKEKIKELISDISHQTKTPLANILLYSQLLGEQELLEDCRAFVKALSAQAEKLSFLIGALVKTSRLETGIISVIPKREAVQKLLEAVTDQIKSKADARHITVSTMSTSAYACFDLKWTAEAVGNIVDNAVKYTPEGRNISINVEPYELFCRIDIIDEGIGIAKEEQSRIFSRFYRSRAVSRQDGAGIGLFLAREILSAQGGYIKVQSEAGKGAAFSVFLPKGK
jgi:two-component system phosphate regulon sensor histidine kinase PhoR